MTTALLLAQMHNAPANGFSPIRQAGTLSALQRQIIVLRQAGVQTIVVVADAKLEAVEQHLSHLGVACFGPPASTAEAPDAVLRRALAHLEGNCTQLLVTPAATALFSPGTVKRLLGAAMRPAAPAYGGQTGFPVLLEWAQFKAGAKLASAGDLPQLLLAGATPLPVEDDGVALLLDAEENWRELLERRLETFRPVTKLMVAREEVFLGPGSRQLLTAIDETGSVRVACSRMGLSYSKGWRIVNGIERQVGFEVVTRQKGGHNGGRSTLSARGKKLLQCYNAYAEECQTALAPIFEKHFGMGSDWGNGPHDGTV